MGRTASSAIVIAAALAFIGAAATDLAAQTIYEGTVEIDRPVYDFGDVPVSRGPLSCTFNIRNVSSGDITILNVASSCGCTGVTWTRESIAPGAGGTISATYSNDEGAFPFDKALTAYISGLKKPVVLRLRGNVLDSEQPLSVTYPVRYGPLGVKTAAQRGPNVEQGQPRSGEFRIANLGDKTVGLSFADVTDGLRIAADTDALAPGQVAVVSYTITPSPDRWGRQIYYATPLADGRRYPMEAPPDNRKKERGAEALLGDIPGLPAEGDCRLAVTSWTKEDFSGLDREQRAAGPRLTARESSASFGKVKAGGKVKLHFEIDNKGKSPARIYSIDSDSSRLTARGDTLIAAGGTGRIDATLDTSRLPAGEVLAILTLTTNCPSRPLVNLYVTGFIR